MPWILRRPLLLSLLLSPLACSNGPSKSVAVDASMTACVEPRPQICTMDYTPVCARLGSGELKTYANGCSACADVKVVSHRPAACE